MIDPQKFIKYWFAFFALHLCWLFSTVANAAMTLPFVECGPAIRLYNTDLFFIAFAFAVMLCALSFVLEKTWRGFVVSSSLCLAASFLGVVVLLSLDTFYFLVFSILGLLGAGLQLVRFRRFPAPH